MLFSPLPAGETPIENQHVRPPPLFTPGPQGKTWLHRGLCNGYTLLTPGPQGKTCFSISISLSLSSSHPCPQGKPKIGARRGHGGQFSPLAHRGNPSETSKPPSASNSHPCTQGKSPLHRGLRKFYTFSPLARRVNQKSGRGEDTAGNSHPWPAGENPSLTSRPRRPFTSHPWPAGEILQEKINDSRPLLLTPARRENPPYPSRACPLLLLTPARRGCPSRAGPLSSIASFSPLARRGVPLRSPARERVRAPSSSSREVARSQTRVRRRCQEDRGSLPGDISSSSFRSLRPESRDRRTLPKFGHIRFALVFQEI